eukprot:gene11253-2046_t
MEHGHLRAVPKGVSGSQQRHLLGVPLNDGQTRPGFGPPHGQGRSHWAFRVCAHAVRRQIFGQLCLLGTRVYTYLSRTLAVEHIGLLVMAGSAACHLIFVLCSENVMVRFVAFVGFEACVGLYFPMVGTLKRDIVPEDMRSTIYNLYRLPLNVVVLMPLLMNFSITTTFTVNGHPAGLHGGCLLSQ